MAICRREHAPYLFSYRLLVIMGVAAAGTLAAQPGLPDPTFLPTDSATLTSYGLNGQVQAIAVQEDGKILVGGSFTTYDDSVRNHIIRLLPDGSLDTSFHMGTGADDRVFDILITHENKIFICGFFTSYDGVLRKSIARLLPAGELDYSFDPGAGPAGAGLAMELQPDGRILMCGFFGEVDGVEMHFLTRLNSDGTVDPTFDTSNGAEQSIMDIALQPDGKVMIVGHFTQYGGIPRSCIARLNTDGSLDPSFDPGTGSAWWNPIDMVAVQPDGKVIMAGCVTVYNGVARARILRANADGSLDASFDPGLGPSGGTLCLSAMALQPDGKVLVGGNFTSFNGQSRHRIARLEADGSLDASFDPAMGTDSFVWTITPQTDGKVLIGGDFTSVNGVPLSRIARLGADPSTAVNGPGRSATVIFPNPTNGMFTVPSVSNEILGITVMDVSGRIILTTASDPSGGPCVIDLSRYPSGVYTIRISDDTRVRASTLLVLPE